MGLARSTFYDVAPVVLAACCRPRALRAACGPDDRRTRRGRLAGAVLAAVVTLDPRRPSLMKKVLMHQTPGPPAVVGDKPQSSRNRFPDQARQPTHGTVPTQR